MYKVGQWVYGIRILEDIQDLEISGYLYIGKCKDYIICTREDGNYLEDFKSQLNAMYEACSNDYMGVKVHLLKNDLTFGDYDEAMEVFEKLCEEYGEKWERENEFENNFNQ